jgi:hypothetical protein
MARTISDADLNSAARGCGFWKMTPEQLDVKAAEHDQIDAFASKVIAKSARQVAAAKRSIQAGMA